MEVLLTADDLLAGADATFEVVIPPALLPAGKSNGSNGVDQESIVRIRPLTIGVFQLIMKAAKNDPGLIPLLMIKESLAEPALSLDQAKRLPLGLIGFLIENIREISGLTKKKSP